MQRKLPQKTFERTIEPIGSYGNQLADYVNTRIALESPILFVENVKLIYVLIKKKQFFTQIENLKIRQCFMYPTGFKPRFVVL